MARSDRVLRVVPGQGGLPGSVRRRYEVAVPRGYAVVDLETTGTDVESDEIVSLAVVRLDAEGVELDRFASLVRPAGPIPAEATAVHGIDDASVADAPSFDEVAGELVGLLEGAVFVAHNAGFDLPLLEHAFARAGIRYRPHGVACTLDAFRLLELLRILLARGIAPETVALDHGAYMRLRSRGDTRPVSEPQVRRVFALARAAGLVALDGTVDRDVVLALVRRVSGAEDVDALTREQVQDVYDELDSLVAETEAAQAASA
jgi:hypothetical protein